MKPVLSAVMAGLVPAIHEQRPRPDVDARDKPGHDVEKANSKADARTEATE
ncbi:hypothetical protein [Rhodopseudomonas telluris]|uniref:Uncharacterized protein n=1 Tax=Rhodopseudomonas telluris TaxID=644215 RepID=A0ABV6ENB2_9BRAD